jgi:hypothetical protein
MIQPRTAAPASLYVGLSGEPGQNTASNVATGPCSTDDCTGLHWTDERAEWHLFDDQTMSEVDPAEWLERHPEVYRDAHLPVPKSVLDFLGRMQPPLPPPTRCTDPDCPDFGKAVDGDHARADGAGTGDDGDEFGMYHDWSDGPWDERPAAKGTFRQRWLLGPKFIRRWHIPHTDYFDAVLTIDLLSWVVGVEVWPHLRGGWLQIGPARVTIDEPPF